MGAPRRVRLVLLIHASSDLATYVVEKRRPVITVVK